MRLQPTMRLENEAATAALAARLGAACTGGEVLLLEGPLGAGKTLFAGAFAAGMGLPGPVPSPTFVLLRSYTAPSGLALHHFDFYRLGSPDDFATLGFEECPGPEAVVLIEWASRVPEAVEAFTLRVRLEPDPECDSARRIEVERGALPLPPGVEMNDE